MKKIKISFIGVVILILFFATGYGIYSSVFAKHNSSYVRAIDGTVQKGDQTLQLSKQYKIFPEDIIRTGENSLAIIEWGDGSITRIGSNSELVIERNEISYNTSFIDIKFHLNAGKTWSKVVSFIGPESSFTQTFNDVEAGVRGTTFSVDLENKIVNVSEHVVAVTRGGESISIASGNILNLSNFNLVDINTYLGNIDRLWTELNAELDRQYIEELTTKLQENIGSENLFRFVLQYFSQVYGLLYELDRADNYEDIQKKLEALDKNKYQKAYREVLDQYQDIHFVPASNYEYYKRKVFYKRVLVYLSDSQIEKEALLESSLYDLSSILQRENTPGLSETLELFRENATILEDIDFSFLSSKLNFIPDGLKIELQKNFRSLQNIFESGISPDIGTVDDSLKNIGNSAKEGLDNINTGIENFLDSRFGETIENYRSKSQ